MSVLNKLASLQNRQDDRPNQELAQELVRENNVSGIQEIAANLRNPDQKIQSDCIKVLYEIGYLKPVLIKDYVQDFLKLIHSKNNRLVWGGMIALSTIAELTAPTIFAHLDELLKIIEKGSVITKDSGIKTLALVAGTNHAYRTKIFPYLLQHLKQCRPKEIPMHAEFIRSAVDATNKKALVEVLEQRQEVLTPTQQKRVARLLRQLETIS